jgi:hypothetical protein
MQGDKTGEGEAVQPASLRYYCCGSPSEHIIELLRQLERVKKLPHEVVDLSTNGQYDAEKERRVYEQDFLTEAKTLKRVTGVSITKLRSKSGNYFVSKPPSLAIVRSGRVAWWTHTDEAITGTIQGILTTGEIPG